MQVEGAFTRTLFQPSGSKPAAVTAPAPSGASFGQGRFAGIRKLRLMVLQTIPPFPAPLTCAVLLNLRRAGAP